MSPAILHWRSPEANASQGSREPFERRIRTHVRFEMPGVGIPIVPPSELQTRRPDYVVLLAWNLADEILRQQADYLRAGGRFVVPVPDPHVIAGGLPS